ncbi:unnamed protein product [Prorocentrum cordatum]|uniref:HECT-type E3 ubiquitin transferase n=1 Tax=Prorocentrum cordatum TaxID=2364126 RepID=A0ABN9X7Z7_9DINO|nr:unnamed protein product [Polarella glacialis]
MPAEGPAAADAAAAAANTAVAEVVAAAMAAAAAASPLPALEMRPEDESVPSWAEFYHQLASELSTSRGGDPELVTLANFDTTARLLVERAAVQILPPGGTDAEGADGPRVLECVAVPAAWNRLLGEQAVGRLRLQHPPEEPEEIGSPAYLSDSRKRGAVVLLSRRSIRHSPHVQNWAQAVSAAAEAGAVAAVVFNNLDNTEPFRMGLFGESVPSIPAFMVGAADGAALGVAASLGCDVVVDGSGLQHSGPTDDAGAPPPWPLIGGRLPVDIAQAWSLLEVLSAHEPGVHGELEALLGRMGVPEKRVWLTRRLVRHHRAKQSPDGGITDPPLAFVECDRSLPPAAQLAAIRQQMCEETGLGSADICGEFEVRFKGEQGVGSAVQREWMDTIAHEAFLHPSLRLLRSHDGRQTFWPDAAAPFCNPQWQLDFEALGRLVGLALWHSCTLDLPLHPRVCALLFGFGRPAGAASLADVDPELQRSKVEWLLSHSVEELGIDLPFSDPIANDDAREDAGAACCGKPADRPEQKAERLPPFVRRSDRLPGSVRSWPGEPLKLAGASEVMLHDGDEEEKLVSDENKDQFVEALVDWRLFGSVEPQAAAMARGLAEVVPEPVLVELRALLSPVEVAQLLSGLGELSVDDWEKHAAYAMDLTRESEV